MEKNVSDRRRELALLDNEFPLVKNERERIKKSIELASARHQLSLNENKLWNYALSVAKKNEQGLYVSEFHMGDFFKATGSKHKGYSYNDLKKFSYNISKKRIFIEDEEQTQFVMMNIVTTVYYDDKNSKVRFEYAPRVTQILDESKKLIALDSNIVFGLSNNTGIVLYEKICLAIEDADNILMGGEKDDIKIYKLSYGLSELKFTLGMVDVYDDNLPKFAKDRIGVELAKSEPDYDLIVSLCADNYFSKYHEVKRALDRAIKLLNEKSDVVIIYEAERGEKGKSIRYINFFAAKKSEQKPSKILSQHDDKSLKTVLSSQEYELFLKAKERFGGHLNDDNLFIVLKAADYNLELIADKLGMALNKCDIRNLTGWLIRAIQNDYKDVSYHNPNGSKWQKPVFLRCMERDYDMDALEKEILSYQENIPVGTYQDEIPLDVINELKSTNPDPEQMTLDLGNYPIPDNEKKSEEKPYSEEDLISMLKTLPNDQIAQVMAQIKDLKLKKLDTVDE